MNPLYGLVLAGGQSSRMGRDKGLLVYRGQPHREYVYDVLCRQCEKVFISVNARQEQTGLDRYTYLVDNPAYETSPMGALLNAHEHYPDASWFIVSCDLAYFDETCLETLLKHRDPTLAGTAFRINELNQPEPLVTIYENAFVGTLPGLYQAGERSLRRALHKAGAELITRFDPRCTRSVDSLEEYEEARRILNVAGGGEGNRDAV